VTNFFVSKIEKEILNKFTLTKLIMGSTLLNTPTTNVFRNNGLQDESSLCAHWGLCSDFLHIEFFKVLLL